ncbi:MAG: hypothetical protein ACRENE_32325 [Polyangiaceae bacterium]
MAASTSPFRVATSLRLGDRVLTRCDDGVLLAEYALFDVSDIVLRATDPVTVREVGYMTTAGEALERLERAGVTLESALGAAQALSQEVASSYARGATARSLVPRLGAHELFDGAIFSASAQRYEGAWLDLRSLAGAVTVPGSSALLQAFHLCAALSEVGRGTPLHLATAAATRNRRPGERTHLRVVFEFAPLMTGALATLQPLAHPNDVEPARDRLLRRALLARVRERSSADTSPEPRTHLANLEGALTLETMPLGPLTEPQMRSLEQRLARGQLEGIDEELDQLEQAGGRTPGIRYLRARTALLRGDEVPRSVAQTLSELVEENHGFHEAALVAARTWLAVGEDAHARYFARRLFDDPSAGDSERLVALEILEATTATEHSHAPPPIANMGSLPNLAPPRMPLFHPLAHVPPPRSFPPEAGSLRPPGYPQGPRPSYPSYPPEAPAPSTLRSPPPLLPGPRPSYPENPLIASPPASFEPRGPTTLRMVVAQEWPGSGPAPSTPGSPAAAPGAPRVGHYDPELVETLALPHGASEATLGLSDLPRTPLQARVALTRLSRDLARDYRLAYGKSMRCNVLAIDAMQQHLVHRFAGATLSDHGVTWELRRHGALVSEIIARALGGGWIDVGPTEPGYWAMQLMPSLVTYPIGRVYRFVAMGHRERDLVGYYLELESRVRGST